MVYCCGWRDDPEEKIKIYKVFKESVDILSVDCDLSVSVVELAVSILL